MQRFLQCWYIFAGMCLLFMGCGLDTAAAAAPQKAWLTAQVSAPLWSIDPVTICLAPDEAACKKAYGSNWREMCAVAPGQTGAPVRGPRLLAGAADVPGQWRWSSSDCLTFMADAPWTPATDLTADLTRLPLPARATLQSASLRLKTPPLAVHVSAGQVWIDPDTTGERALSFDLSFTAPPRREAVQKDLTLQVIAKDKKKSLSLGEPQIVWGLDGTSCLIKARILKMPGEDTAVELRVPGAAALTRDQNQWRIHARQEARQRVVIPGADNLFKVKEARLRQVSNAELAMEYHLELQTTLLVRPEALLPKITVVQLPEKQNPEALQPYVWDRAPALTAEDINKGEKLTPEILQTPDAADSMLRLRIPVQPGRYVFVHLPAGFGPENSKGLPRPWQGIFRAPRLDVSVDFMQPGNVLTLGGSPVLDIHSLGAKAIEWRVSRVMRPHLGMLGEYSYLFRRRAYENVDAYSVVTQGSISVPPVKDGAPQFSTLDLAPLLAQGKGLFQVELEARAAEGTRTDNTSRMILLTDMGVVAKRGADGALTALVCSLSTGEPVSGALVQVLGVNSLPVAEARTDAQGRAMLPPLKGLTREKRPTALLIVKEKAGQPDDIEDMSWLSLEDSNRQVDYSRFPTQGQVSAGDGVNAYVFPQRGIFRPGETLYFGALVRRGDWQPLPPDMPLTAILRDPADREVMRRHFQAGAPGLHAFEWASSESSPTGRYRLYIESGNTVFGSGAARLDEFQPDTLSIKTSVAPAPAKGWLHIPEGAAGDAAIQVALNNLYGTPAADRRIRARLEARSAPLQFAGFEQYIFHDAQPYKGEPLERDLAETRTDTQGQALVPLALNTLRSGTLHCSVLVEGFEPGGGRAVTSQQAFVASPLAVVLGYRPEGPGTNLSYIPQAQQTALEFIALDPQLQRADPGPLTFTVSERRYVISLVTGKDGRYSYEETPLKKDIHSETLRLPADGALRWSVPTEKPGEFLLTVRDAGQKVMAQMSFNVAGNAALRPENYDDLPSSVLRLHCNKTGYAPGETVEIFLTAPYDGMGLLTLERDSVAAHQWFKVKAGSSVQRIAIPEDFEGRGYINVSVARALHSPDIFMQPHSYALAPITVNVAQRDMGLAVHAPELTLPGGTIQATVTAKTPGQAVLFAVDEGVLSLTRFATPNPLRYLLLDRALEVDTRLMFDLLMPDHTQLKRRMPAFGGDMALSGGRFHNPFKRRNEPPLTWWSPPVEVGPQGTTINIPVPPWYNGNVRIMAVGASEATAGKAQAPAVVRGPVVLTPQLPLFVAPGDSFDAALALANNEKTPLTLALRADYGSLLAVQTDLPGEITLQPGAETVLPLRLQAGAEPGAADVRFTATDAQGRETARASGLSVRPASPVGESLLVGSTTASRTLETGRELLTFEASGSASVSPMPLPALRGLYRYLHNYTYRCVEQRISRALPLALLLRQPDLLKALGAQDGERAAKERRTSMDDAVSAIAAALSSNGVVPWTDFPGQGKLLLTAYAGDYLLALHEAGYSVPNGLDIRLFNVLETLLHAAPEDLGQARAQAYALWVLTRSGRITTAQLEQLISVCNTSFEGWRDDITAVLLAGTYSVMRMDKEALALIQRFTMPGANFYAYDALDTLAAQSMAVAILARHFPQLLNERADDLVARLMESCNKKNYVTFSAAQGMRALLALGGASGRAGDRAAALNGVRLACAALQPGFDNPPQPIDAVLAGGMLTLDAPGCAAYQLSMPEMRQPLYWEVSSRGFDRRPPAQPVAEGMEVKRVYADADGQTVTSVRQGDVLTVTLTAKIHGEEAMDVVLCDLLPGGFEMMLDPLPEGAARLERREDRMLVFAALEREPLTVSYRIRAVNKGNYALPALQGEAMYNRAVWSSTAAGEIRVE